MSYFCIISSFGRPLFGCVIFVQVTCYFKLSEVYGHMSSQLRAQMMENRDSVAALSLAGRVALCLVRIE